MSDQPPREPEEPSYLTWSSSKPANPTASPEQTVASAPPLEHPVPEEPIAEAPIAEAPIAEEPIAEAPIAEQPVEPVTPGSDDRHAQSEVAGDASLQAKPQPEPQAEREPDPAPPDAAVEHSEDSVRAVDTDLVLSSEPVAKPEPLPEPEAQPEPAQGIDALLVTDRLDPTEPEEEVAEWMHPAPVEPVVVIDEPIVPRDEPEEITVAESDDVDEVIEEADDDEDEIVFDLASLSTEERRHLSMRLTGAGIAHVWEVATDLVVSVKDAPQIESYLEEVRNPDGFGDEELVAFDADEDVDDEGIYAAMSGLYVAADKLMQRVNDPSVRTAFYDATDDVDGLPAPFGFDPRVWNQVLDLANSIADAMDAEVDDDAIATDARTLRQLLVNYV